MQNGTRYTPNVLILQQSVINRLPFESHISLAVPAGAIVDVLFV